MQWFWVSEQLGKGPGFVNALEEIVNKVKTYWKFK